MEKEIRILVSGGGTGGHIFPALSIANELKRRFPNAKFLFVGALGRMEMERVPAAGYEIIGLPVKGFDRKNMLKNIPVAWNLMRSILKARKIIKEFRPDVAIGVGGYVSGPVLKAAQKAGVPTLIQEQNSYAGVTNKLLAKNANAICVAYEGMERFFPQEKIILTGNPVRRNVVETQLTVAEARERLGLDASKRTVLVVGGSLGARTVNESIIGGINAIREAEGVQVLWQTGKYYDEQCREALKANPATNIIQTAFISDMEAAYAAADLVVSRAGASSISELQILGKPSILVPSPNVAEDHQTKNALALVNQNAALMVRDAEASEKLVAMMLKAVTDSANLASLSANVKAMALPNADEIIANKAEELMKIK